MKSRGAHPIAFFNEWFAEPIVVTDPSVAGVIDALNRHPLADDQTAQDNVMPTRRCRERAGRFRICGENQDTYYCFVYEVTVEVTGQLMGPVGALPTVGEKI